MTAEMVTRKQISRRKFLKIAGISIGATTVICGGTSLVGLTPHPDKLIEAHLGDTTARQRYLVAYATKCGSTGEVALAIGKELNAGGAAVDVLPVQSVTSKLLSERNYSGAVIGSAVRIGGILAGATNLVKNNKKFLAKIPVAYFVSCFTMHEDTGQNRTTAAGYLAPLRENIPPVSEGLFGGKMYYSKLEPLMRLMLSAAKSSDFPEGDWRKWDAIQAWARGVASAFRG